MTKTSGYDLYHSDEVLRNNKDKRKAFYSMYHEFLEEPDKYRGLLKEITPIFESVKDIVSRVYIQIAQINLFFAQTLTIKCGIDLLKNNSEQELSTIQQLAVITALRKFLTTTETPDAGRILKETPIMEIVA